jgi:hypothetical protein
MNPTFAHCLALAAFGVILGANCDRLPRPLGVTAAALAFIALVCSAVLLLKRIFEVLAW